MLISSKAWPEEGNTGRRIGSIEMGQSPYSSSSVLAVSDFDGRLSFFFFFLMLTSITLHCRILGAAAGPFVAILQCTRLYQGEQVQLAPRGDQTKCSWCMADGSHGSRLVPNGLGLIRPSPTYV